MRLKSQHEILSELDQGAAEWKIELRNRGLDLEDTQIKESLLFMLKTIFEQRELMNPASLKHALEPFSYQEALESYEAQKFAYEREKRMSQLVTEMIELQTGMKVERVFDDDEEEDDDSF